MQSGQVSATAQVMAELFEGSRNGVDLHVRGVESSDLEMVPLD
jgi:hypothetical protein